MRAKVDLDEAPLGRACRRGSVPAADVQHAAADFAGQSTRVAQEVEDEGVGGPFVDLLRASDLEALGREEAPAAASDAYTGLGVASGVAAGRVRVLASPADAGDLGAGYVLVCPTTDPSWTPLFVNAAAIVVERGGMLSHGAIVARDFGIPAVVLHGATRLLSEGAAVKVDGNRGRVELAKG